MLDTVGGWKALDTAALRDVNHAATMIGRMAAAAVAVQRGYAIEADHGPSGKLDHWRIAGIPKAACDALSKRSAEIELHMESVGFVGYRARGIGARATRDAKSDESPEQLLPRWLDELDELDQSGWPARRIADRLRVVNERAAVPTPLTEADLHRLASQLLSADGDLGNRKAFTRPDIIRVLAPNLYGFPGEELDRAVQAVIEHREAIPLVGQPAARGKAWAAASMLAAEQAVAEVSRRLAQRDGVAVNPDVITKSLTAKERSIGRALTRGQSAAVYGICAEARGLDLIIGVAGSSAWPGPGRPPPSTPFALRSRVMASARSARRRVARQLARSARKPT